MPKLRSARLDVIGREFSVYQTLKKEKREDPLERETADRADLEHAKNSECQNSNSTLRTRKIEVQNQMATPLVIQV